jgi:hypothetical protein
VYQNRLFLIQVCTIDIAIFIGMHFLWITLLSLDQHLAKRECYRMVRIIMQLDSRFSKSRHRESERLSRRQRHFNDIPAKPDLAQAGAVEHYAEDQNDQLVTSPR